ncbi:MAG: Biosynthetic arginine decarboxylase [Verrucomicrobia subdivision 3 bacterium]|nr:Biosynthetic arginine decarboxylase [Limisphaerales bacterium]MCS1414550.1 Biosynthetic arginine decarboxylase [Limisphaerales bacterium]
MGRQPIQREAWTREAARDLYHIKRWGGGYFDINESGHVFASPNPEQGSTVDLINIVAEAKRRNLRFPLLIRFQDILRHRVKAINEAFENAIEECEYKGRYRGVFPIKVNQLREVVEEVIKAGKPYGFGLEVGSKPELFAALALQTSPNSLLICNGYKDPSFIRMALMGIKLGKKVIVVIEKLEELEQIIKVSKETDVQPMIGIRARLLSKGAGKWADSSGETAKFGLSTAELVTAADQLTAENLQDCFQLLHFHIGSQIPDIQSIKRATQEATRLYAQLHKMGFNIRNIDVGGGLGVDYDGSRTACESSTNYTLQEYANDIVYHIGDVCNAEGVPHPEITSESGRAIVAHHSALIVEVFGMIEKGAPNCQFDYNADEHAVIKELLDIKENLQSLNPLEAFHDAMERKDDAQHMFNLGILSLRDKAKIENLAWEICRSVKSSFAYQAFVPEEIRSFEEQIGDQYLCNFSVFQSLLDHWACNQLFPVMPISRLLEEPTKETTLADITCDSDGQINRFIDLDGGKDTLRLHELNGKASNHHDYYLGFFLIGAYQDIMGDLHNLFGKVNEVHIFLDSDEPCGYYIEEIIPGNTIQGSLRAVQYDEKELSRQMKAQVESAIEEDRLKSSEAMQLLQDYNASLNDYTYLRF